MNLPEDQKCKNGSWCETLLMVLCIFIGFFTLAYCTEPKAACTGSVLFVGYGIDNGPINYKVTDDMQERYRDRNQNVMGLEHNWKHVRIQLYKSSSIDNKFDSSFGDMWMTSAQFKLDF